MSSSTHRKEQGEVMELSGAWLEALLTYDPADGFFRHKTYRGPRSGGPCSIAGTKMDTGYIMVGVLGQRFLAHRLAWLWMTGRWPSAEIDHINGVRDDNRFCNLREATRAQQGANGAMRITNTSGVVGVFWDTRRRLFDARIGVNNKSINLGRFKTLKEAASAREVAEKKYFGEFRRMKECDASSKRF